MDYREQARQAFTRATQLLKEGEDPNKLKYVALELRMALEALTYQRAENYKEELSSVDLEKWQPRKLLELLLEIDPMADKSPTISFGLEEEYGKPAKEMKLLGTNRVLSLTEIKKYYDRLGSYLHTPTASQAAKGQVEAFDKIKTRCNELIAVLNEVFSSKIFNADFRSVSKLLCLRCDKEVVRRMPPNVNTLIAKCINCPATYTLTLEDEVRVRWEPRMDEIECANPACNSISQIWERDVKIGNWVKCKECGGRNKLVFGITHIFSDDSKNG